MTYTVSNLHKKWNLLIDLGEISCLTSRDKESDLSCFNAEVNKKLVIPNWSNIISNWQRKRAKKLCMTPLFLFSVTFGVSCKKVQLYYMPLQEAVIVILRCKKYLSVEVSSYWKGSKASKHDTEQVQRAEGCIRNPPQEGQLPLGQWIVGHSQWEPTSKIPFRNSSWI